MRRTRNGAIRCPFNCFFAVRLMPHLIPRPPRAIYRTCSYRPRQRRTRPRSNFSPGGT
jgi:hypothetical protein